jgi:hypothetical protein
MVALEYIYKGVPCAFAISETLLSSAYNDVLLRLKKSTGASYLLRVLLFKFVFSVELSSTFSVEVGFTFLDGV